jgi:hypothetical protein
MREKKAHFALLASMWDPVSTGRHSKLKRIAPPPFLVTLKI